MVKVKVNLSTLLGAKRINQAQLSRITKIRYNTINDLYHEIAEGIKFEHLEKICDALECKSSELIEYVPKKKP
jgi:putative transcriptional regulator